MTACTNCGNPKLYRRRLCVACVRWEQRHDGAPRPPEIQRRHIARLILRQLARHAT